MRLQIVDLEQGHITVPCHSPLSQSFGHARVERVAQSVAEQVHGQDGDRQERRGEGDGGGPPLAGAGALRQDCCPRRDGPALSGRREKTGSPRRSWGGRRYGPPARPPAPACPAGWGASRSWGGGCLPPPPHP